MSVLVSHWPKGSRSLGLISSQLEIDDVLRCIQSYLLLAMNTSSQVRGSRPSPLQSSKSFSRFEPPRSNPTSRNRATTLQTSPIPEVQSPEKRPHRSTHDGAVASQTDVFEKQSFDEDSGASRAAGSALDASIGSLPENFDELPIELISLSDR